MAELLGYIVTARGAWVSPKDFANGASVPVRVEEVDGGFGYLCAGAKLSDTFTVPETGWYERVDGQWQRMADPTGEPDRG